uniref:Uncharacterized protein n=1 Tax=Arundo donax TaxID=35708 RepID=A0A0A9BAR3_ARUDO
MKREYTTMVNHLPFMHNPHTDNHWPFHCLYLYKEQTQSILN